MKKTEKGSKQTESTLTNDQMSSEKPLRIPFSLNFNFSKNSHNQKYCKIMPRKGHLSCKKAYMVSPNFKFKKKSLKPGRRDVKSYDHKANREKKGFADYVNDLENNKSNNQIEENSQKRIYRRRGLVKRRKTKSFQMAKSKTILNRKHRNFRVSDCVRSFDLLGKKKVSLNLKKSRKSGSNCVNTSGDGLPFSPSKHNMSNGSSGKARKRYDKSLFDKIREKKILQIGRKRIDLNEYKKIVKSQKKQRQKSPGSQKPNFFLSKVKQKNSKKSKFSIWTRKINFFRNPISKTEKIKIFKLFNSKKKSVNLKKVKSYKDTLSFKDMIPEAMSEIAKIEVKLYDLENLGYFKFTIESVFKGVVVAYYGDDRHLTMSNFKSLLEDRCSLISFSDLEDKQSLDDFRFIVKGIPEYDVFTMIYKFMKSMASAISYLFAENFNLVTMKVKDLQEKKEREKEAMDNTLYQLEEKYFLIECDVFESLRQYQFMKLLEKGGFYLDKNIPSVKELRTIGFIRKATLQEEFY